MVFKFDEAEFHWRWKWFFRPRQVTGMPVEDYHTQFRDWNEEMINISFPAEEEDYIDGFVENLRWDIRSRVVSKCRLSINRLSDAFYAAKFEESMLFIEETLKKIKANMVFDEIPSRTPIECEEDVCSSIKSTWKADVQENDSRELQFQSLIEEDLSNHEGTKVPRHMFDEMPGRILIEFEGADTHGSKADESQVSLKSNERNLKTLEPWSDSEIENAQNEGDSIDKAKKDEHSEEERLKDMEIISHVAPQVIETPTLYDHFTHLFVQINRRSFPTKFEVYFGHLYSRNGISMSNGCRNDDIAFLFDPGGRSCSLRVWSWMYLYSFDWGGKVERKAITAFKRHKVCEIHSRTAKVHVNGVEQRFCQQCSRFHSLSEFDNGKRSCRKRLPGHNDRRRKNNVILFSSRRLIPPHSSINFLGSSFAAAASLVCPNVLHPLQKLDINNWNRNASDNTAASHGINNMYSSHKSCFNANRIPILRGLIAAFFGSILKKWGSEKLCDEATGEMPENAVKMFVYTYVEVLLAHFNWIILARMLLSNKCAIAKSEMNIFMVKQLAMVCCVTYSSSIFSCMSEFGKLLCTQGLTMGGSGHDCIQNLIARNAGNIDMIQIWAVCWINSTFGCLPTFHVTLSLDMKNLVISLNIQSGSNLNNCTISNVLRSGKLLSCDAFMCKDIWEIIVVTKAIENQRPSSFLIIYLRYSSIYDIREVIVEGWEPLYLLNNGCHKKYFTKPGDALILELEVDGAYLIFWDVIANNDDSELEKNKVVYSLSRLLEFIVWLKGNLPERSNCYLSITNVTLLYTSCLCLRFGVAQLTGTITVRRASLFWDISCSILRAAPHVLLGVYQLVKWEGDFRKAQKLIDRHERMNMSTCEMEPLKKKKTWLTIL